MHYVGVPDCPRGPRTTRPPGFLPCAAHAPSRSIRWRGVPSSAMRGGQPEPHVGRQGHKEQARPAVDLARCTAQAPPHTTRRTAARAAVISGAERGRDTGDRGGDAPLAAGIDQVVHHHRSPRKPVPDGLPAAAAVCGHMLVSGRRRIRPLFGKD